MPLTLRVKLVFVVGCANTIVSMGISAGPEETAKSLHYLHACVRACSCVRACVCVCAFVSIYVGVRVAPPLANAHALSARCRVRRCMGSRRRNGRS
jgi:hypothetical protein